MGISIEQFRSRIRSHDNFVKIKDVSSRFKDRFWNVMLMTFYLNVFYLLTLKQVVIPYKMLNQVMFWFTQMMCYNVYIPLLIRQANDVEENPGPTIFDIIDLMITVSADYSQGNEALFGENAGKQCVAMSLTAIIYHQVEHINEWTSSTLNNILTIGNNLYVSISKDFYGMLHSFGKCTLLSIKGLKNLVSYLQMSCSEVRVVSFEIRGVSSVIVNLI